MKKIAMFIIVSMNLTALTTSMAARLTCEKDARVSTSVQRIVILWNGTTEVLFLSTDLSNPTSMTIHEVIPFPSQPTAKIGSLDTFKQLLALEQSIDPLRIETSFSTNQQISRVADIKIGQAKTSSDFLELYSKLFGVNNPINVFSRSGINLISDYQKRGFNWFAFNTAKLTSMSQSFLPVEYKFSTNRLYYPISASSSGNAVGETQLSIMTITTEAIYWKHLSNAKYRRALPIDELTRVNFQKADLARINSEWGAMFPDAPLQMEIVTISDNIQSMTKDILSD